MGDIHMEENINKLEKIEIVLSNKLLTPLQPLLNKKSILLDDASISANMAINKANILVSSVWERVSEELLSQLPNIKKVYNFGIGTDNIDYEYLQAKNIECSHLSSFGSEDTAELAIALMLAITRNIINNHNYVSGKNWIHSNQIPFGHSVIKKNCGILGLGHVGLACAQRAAALGMNILYHSRTRKNVAYMYCETAIELAEKADYLILCCSSNKETHQIVNREMLHALGKGGYLINVSRGSVINDPALIESLQNQWIRGAALDVFDKEPNISEMYYKLPNIILSPHMGSRTYENINAMFTEMAKQINNYL